MYILYIYIYFSVYIGVSASITYTRARIHIHIHLLSRRPSAAHGHIRTHAGFRGCLRCGRRQICPAHTSSEPSSASYCKLKIGWNASSSVWRTATILTTYNAKVRSLLSKRRKNYRLAIFDWNIFKNIGVQLRNLQISRHYMELKTMNSLENGCL